MSSLTKFRIDQRVYDTYTGAIGTVVQIDAVDVDGAFVDFYLLDDSVPLSADYPDRYRHEEALEDAVVVLRERNPQFDK